MDLRLRLELLQTCAALLAQPVDYSQKRRLAQTQKRCILQVLGCSAAAAVRVLITLNP